MARAGLLLAVVLVLGFAADALVMVTTQAHARPARVPTAADKNPGSGFFAASLPRPARLAGPEKWSAVTIGITVALAACGGVLALGKRFSPQRGGAGIQVVGRVSLSPKHTVYMLQVGHRVLLLGAGPQGAPALISEARRSCRKRAGTSFGKGNMTRQTRIWFPRLTSRLLAVALGAALSLVTMPGRLAAADEVRSQGASLPRITPAATPAIAINQPAEGQDASTVSPLRLPPERDIWKTVETVALFGLISLAPMAVLMVTAFVRINIVLLLLRQALGSPQVPGNQILTALSILLTALVMWPLGEKVYHDAIVPYKTGTLPLAQAWEAGSQPIKKFMVDQIERTNHHDYLLALNEYTLHPSQANTEKSPSAAQPEDFPLRVVAPAYLLSELTTALMMGFYIYLPFLVIDLVVSSVLAATGLFMLPPASWPCPSS